MDTAIIVALIAGGLPLIGTIVTVKNNNKKLLQDMEAKLTEKMQDVKDDIVREMNSMKIDFAASKAATDTRLDDLTQEVRKHNGFADRMPRMEAEIEGVKERIKYLHQN